VVLALAQAFQTMARPVRLHYRDAVYHVMARGNQDQAVFRDARDHHTFLDTLGEACARTGWQIHAYCPMPNQYSLLLRMPEPNQVGNLEARVLELAKVARKKVASAWWVRERTTVPLRWVSERLEMGHNSRVKKAVSRIRRRPGARLEKLRRRPTAP
jgi:REP element-mobilizing transposase RayT